MVDHNWQMRVFKNEQISWERSQNFGCHLLVFYEVRSAFIEFLKQTENLICNEWIWSLQRCFLNKFITGSDELLP